MASGLAQNLSSERAARTSFCSIRGAVGKRRCWLNQGLVALAVHGGSFRSEYILSEVPWPGITKIGSMRLPLCWVESLVPRIQEWDTISGEANLSLGASLFAVVWLFGLS